MSIANKRDERRACDGDQEEHEDGHGQRIEKGISSSKILRVELEEKHFEGHFRSQEAIFEIKSGMKTKTSRENSTVKPKRLVNI